jgi:hypothetical protein
MSTVATLYLSSTTVYIGLLATLYQYHLRQNEYSSDTIFIIYAVPVIHTQVYFPMSSSDE